VRLGDRVLIPYDPQPKALSRSLQRKKERERKEKRRKEGEEKGGKKRREEKRRLSGWLGGAVGPTRKIGAFYLDTFWRKWFI
jgi:hypothetical protein